MKSLILATVVLSIGCSTFAANDLSNQLNEALEQSQSEQNQAADQVAEKATNQIADKAADPAADQMAMSLRKFLSRPVKVMYAKSKNKQSNHNAVSSDGMVIRLKKVKKKT